MVMNMENVRIVFMGTPVFGKEILKTLVENYYQVVAVVTQPDKAVGRKKILTAPPVKEYALSQQIEVLQPIKIKEDYQRIVELQPDLIVTCAYGQMIPKQLLQLPRLGCINVHASLLPKLRGGAPIQHAIMDGYTKSGVTIMEMVPQMDAGDMISQKSVDILENDTYGSLHDRLIQCATRLLVETLPSIIEGNYTKLPQNIDEVTYGYNITKEQERIDLSQDYDTIYNQIRGLIPNPCAYFLLDGKKVKVYEVEKTDIVQNYENGTILFVGKYLGLVIDQRVMIIKKLQLEGKNVNTASEVRNGAGRNWQYQVCQ